MSGIEPRTPPFELRRRLTELFDNGAWELTSTEVDQLENIDSTTISAAQWAYVGAMDQGVATTNDVQFANVNISDSGAVIPEVRSTDNSAVQLRLRSDSTNRRILARTGADATVSQVQFPAINVVAVTGTANNNGSLAIGKTTTAEALDVNGAATFNSNRVKGVATPTATTDAANKDYVDTAVAAASPIQTATLITTAIPSSASARDDMFSFSVESGERYKVEMVCCGFSASADTALNVNITGASHTFNYAFSSTGSSSWSYAVFNLDTASRLYLNTGSSGLLTNTFENGTSTFISAVGILEASGTGTITIEGRRNSGSATALTLDADLSYLIVTKVS